jgi:ATP-dependent DNA helicase RecG
MSTTHEELEQLRVIPRETPHLEFKQAKKQWSHDALFEYAVGIGNEGGGRLILGMTNDPPRKIVGTGAFRDTNAIEAKALQVLGFRIDVDEVTHPDGRVLVIHIPSRPIGKPLHYDGKYLMRVGESLVPMTGDQLRKIFDEGRPDFLSEIARASLRDEDVIELLDTQTFYDLQERKYPESREEVLAKLCREHIAVARPDGCYDITNLGALLCAKQLGIFGDLARRAPRVVVYDGTTKATTKLDVFGSRGYAIGFEGLIDFISSHLPQNEMIEKALRTKVKMLPDVVLREVVANALIHQDFSETGMCVAVEIYGDRVEIKNPGLPLITTMRFIDENQSRNERLAAIMRRLRICEEKGSGIDRVVSAAELMQLPAPDFRVGERHTAVVLFGPRPIEEMAAADRIRACYQHCVLRFISNQTMTNESLRERFRLPESKAETVSRIIRDTFDAQLIKNADPSSQSKRYRRYVPFWV